MSKTRKQNNNGKFQDQTPSGYRSDPPFTSESIRAMSRSIADLSFVFEGGIKSEIEEQNKMKLQFIIDLENAFKEWNNNIVDLSDSLDEFLEKYSVTYPQLGSFLNQHGLQLIFQDAKTNKIINEEKQIPKIHNVFLWNKETEGVILAFKVTMLEEKYQGYQQISDFHDIQYFLHQTEVKLVCPGAAELESSQCEQWNQQLKAHLGFLSQIQEEKKIETYRLENRNQLQPQPQAFYSSSSSQPFFQGSCPIQQNRSLQTNPAPYSITKRKI